MSFEEIKQASKEKLDFDRRQTSEISETTPPAITSAIIAFARGFSTGAPDFVSVAPDQFGTYGWCCDGVRAKIATDGGSEVFGWTIWEWPQVLLTAEFHCVWKSDDGDLVDITPKPQHEERILFVPDPNYSPEFNFDNRPGNKRASLFEEPDTYEIADQKISKMSASQLSYETRRSEKAGLSLQEFIAKKHVIHPLAAAIDDFILQYEDHDREFDSFGVSGQVAVTNSFIAKAKRLNETLLKVRRLHKDWKGSKS